jgi:hypothetical protein
MSSFVDAIESEQEEWRDITTKEEILQREIACLERTLEEKALELTDECIENFKSNLNSKVTSTATLNPNPDLQPDTEMQATLPYANTSTQDTMPSGSDGKGSPATTRTFKICAILILVQIFIIAATGVYILVRDHQ